MSDPYPPPYSDPAAPPGGSSPYPGAPTSPGPYAGGPGGQPTYPGSPGYGPPGYPGGGHDSPPGSGGWSGLAIAAFVVGLVVPLVGILVAVPLGIVALVTIGKSRKRGKGLAISGMVLSVLWIVAFVGLAVVLVNQTAQRDEAGTIVEEGRIDFGEIQVGDCVDIPGAGEGDIDPFDVRGVPCDEPHNAETVELISIEQDDYPGQTDLNSASTDQCFATVSEVVGADRSGYQDYRLIPDESIWEDDNGHRVICFVAETGFGEMDQPLS